MSRDGRPLYHARQSDTRGASIRASHLVPPGEPLGVSHRPTSRRELALTNFGSGQGMGRWDGYISHPASRRRQHAEGTPRCQTDRTGRHGLIVPPRPVRFFSGGGGSSKKLLKNGTTPRTVLSSRGTRRDAGTPHPSVPLRASHLYISLSLSRSRREAGPQCGCEATCLRCIVWVRPPGTAFRPCGRCKRRCPTGRRFAKRFRIGWSSLRLLIIVVPLFQNLHGLFNRPFK